MSQKQSPCSPPDVRVNVIHTKTTPSFSTPPASRQPLRMASNRQRHASAKCDTCSRWHILTLAEIADSAWSQMSTSTPSDRYPANVQQPRKVRNFKSRYALSLVASSPPLQGVASFSIERSATAKYSTDGQRSKYFMFPDLFSTCPRS